MAESQKRASSSVNPKEKNALFDLDIGKDFLSSWKSISAGDGDALDFDLAPVSKGKKKSFNFEKADMDFNLDDDFGKMPSFNMDMSDLDISPPLKKDGKATEKAKESSTGNDNGKADRFTFAFDFDELEDFNFDASLTKKSSKAEKEKGKMGSSPNRSGLQGKEGSSDTSVIGKANTLENLSQKRSLPATSISFDMDFNVSESPELESTKEKCPYELPTDNSIASESTMEKSPKLAMDDSIASKPLTATDEVASDTANTSPVITIDYSELQKNTESEKSVFSEPVDLEACTGDDAVNNLSSGSLAHDQYSGGSSGEAQEEVDLVETDPIGSSGEHDVTVTSVVGSTTDNKLTMVDNSEHDTNASSEQNTGDKGHGEIEDHMRDDKERTKCGQVNPLVENSCTTIAEPELLPDSVTGRKNQDLASEIHKLPSISHPPENMLEKEIEKQREAPVSLTGFILPENHECHVQIVSSGQTIGELNKKKGFTQPSRAEGISDLARIQSHRKLASLSLSHSQTLLRRELSKTHSQQSSNGINISGEVSGANGLPNEKRLKDFRTVQNLNVVKEKSSQGQREMSIKDPDTLRKICNGDGVQEAEKLNSFPGGQNPDVLKENYSQVQKGTSTKDHVTKDQVIVSSNTEINKRMVQNSKLPTTLPSSPLTGNTPKGLKLSVVEGSRKTPDLCGQKLSSLSLNSAETSSRKDIKSVGNIGQNRVLVRNKPLEISYSVDTQRQTHSTLSMKRKILEGYNAEKTVLYPSKRPSLSPIRSRQIVETSEKISDKKVPGHKAMEDDSIKTNLGDCQVSTLDIPDRMNIEGLEISYSTESNSNIKQAEAYAKELDDISNLLRKKQEEAKEMLVRAILNSNKLLMLNHPLFEEKICATQNLLARLTLNEGHA